ncbi:ParB/RepB/Spo0J family partition protein [Rhizobium lemnae]|uniref:ParB/RepB/Spo0J family partition protein n=1 Tax=Rhizobium lemnae TaxID=1214924 RepID=A0ABV8E4Z6_9HYPH|nr:ParB/RepB/Spo0J family partition protein [Rhizobium lemnae]MCJ8506617.1 ParB/RepB/Spo0J family partition protein [Rhizobium lemnae]
MPTDIHKSDALFRFEMTRASLNALTSMISATMSQGDGLDAIAMGVYNLLSDQCDELQTIENAFREDFRRIRQGLEAVQELPGAEYYEQTMALVAKLMSEGKTLTQIEALTKLSKSTIVEFIDDMPDSMKEQAIAESKKADPRELRKDFIASKVNDGVDAGAIANALNLKRETVEKVIRQLKASTDSSAISNSSSDQRSAHG